MRHSWVLYILIYVSVSHIDQIIINTTFQLVHSDITFRDNIILDDIDDDINDIIEDDIDDTIEDDINGTEFTTHCLLVCEALQSFA